MTQDKLDLKHKICVHEAMARRALRGELDPTYVLEHVIVDGADVCHEHPCRACEESTRADELSIDLVAAREECTVISELYRKQLRETQVFRARVKELEERLGAFMLQPEQLSVVDKLRMRAEEAEIERDIALTALEEMQAWVDELQIDNDHLFAAQLKRKRMSFNKDEP